ncbi:MAG: cyclase [Chitinophagaceae bacterium]|nr:cyclase [Chitinophagaceae bacterium]
MQMLDMTPSTSTRVLVKHKIKDWDAWKKVFDADKPNRTNAGLTDRALGYEAGDNHMVSMVFLVSDMKKADDFSKSEALKKKMEEAGVEGPPTFFYYNQVKKY